MSRAPRTASRGAPARDRERTGPRAGWGLRLVRNLLLWLVPVALLWLIVTPFYNRVLEGAGENLLHLMESPNVTRLAPSGAHYALIVRTDFPPAREVTGSFRVTDLHFHLILLAGLFLATPGVPAARRLSDLGTAVLIAVFFHLALVVLWVEFTYATQLGAWSLENYGPVARNLWGLGKHVLDLPVKLALPLLLWAAFYLDRLLPSDGADRAADRA